MPAVMSGQARWHPPAADPDRAVLCVGGFDGGFSGPDGIYEDLAAELPGTGIAVLRLDFRIKTAPGPIDEGTEDVLAGIAWLERWGVRRIALVGHSYGGAIVIRAAARSRAVAAIAALATQTAGIEPADLQRLAGRPLLLIHGEADWRLPPALSRWVYQQAPDPKRLEILERATHSLRQRRSDVLDILRTWLAESLPPAPPALARP